MVRTTIKNKETTETFEGTSVGLYSKPDQDTERNVHPNCYWQFTTDGFIQSCSNPSLVLTAVQGFTFDEDEQHPITPRTDEGQNLRLCFLWGKFISKAGLSVHPFHSFWRSWSVRKQELWVFQTMNRRIWFIVTFAHTTEQKCLVLFKTHPFYLPLHLSSWFIKNKAELIELVLISKVWFGWWKGRWRDDLNSKQSKITDQSTFRCV